MLELYCLGHKSWCSHIKRWQNRKGDDDDLYFHTGMCHWTHKCSRHSERNKNVSILPKYIQNYGDNFLLFFFVLFSPFDFFCMLFSIQRKLFPPSLFCSFLLETIFPGLWLKIASRNYWNDVAELRATEVF